MFAACLMAARYLPFSFDKLGYLLQMSPKECWIGNFIPARREADIFYNPEHMKNISKYKATPEYWSNDPASWPKTSMPYEGKGYFPINGTVNDWDYFTEVTDWTLNIEEFSKDWEKGLLDIVDFCAENEIELTIFSAPIPPVTLIGHQNSYDDYINYVNELLDGTGVKYYDFNLLKEEYFPNRSELFAEYSHLSRSGSEKFTNLLADLIKGSAAEEELFYDTYAERMSVINPTVFGITHGEVRYSAEGEPVKVYPCKIVSSRDDMEYEILAADSSGNEYFYRDFSDEILFDLPADISESGTLRIRYRLKSGSEQIWETNVST